MALYFVRHGETDWNRQKRFQSTTDVPLNARGIEQAGCIRAEFQRRRLVFGVAFTSPLGRAAETAKILLNGSHTPLNVDPALLEMSFGHWEGLLESELAERFGEQFTTWRESHYTTAPPGGECIETCLPRIRDFAQRVAEIARTEDVLVVAHQAIMMAFKAALSARAEVSDALSYKQNNDELDIWDTEKMQRIEKLRVECPEGTTGADPGSSRG
jgi:broad specificity phosphatase PhoE